MTNEERTAKLTLALAAAREANERLKAARAEAARADTLLARDRENTLAMRAAQANIQRITALLDEVLKPTPPSFYCQECDGTGLSQ